MYLTTNERERAAYMSGDIENAYLLSEVTFLNGEMSVAKCALEELDDHRVVAETATDIVNAAVGAINHLCDLRLSETQLRDAMRDLAETMENWFPGDKVDRPFEAVIDAAREGVA